MQEKKASFLARFVKGVKVEFKKIIFPSRQDVVQQGLAVIIVSFIIGVFISVFDILIKTGLGFILQ